MALHIFTGAGAPSNEPTQIGHHYIDTLNKVSYISVGTSSTDDWVINDAELIVSEHVAESDPHPQYLTEAEGDGAYDALGAGAAAQDFSIQRSNHTGTQAISTVSGLQSALDSLVTGPASATDNGVVRFDSTTGKLVKDSSVTIDDSGALSAASLSASSLSSGSVLFSGSGGAVSQDNSNLFWNSSSHRLGISTSSPSTDLAFGPGANKTIQVETSLTGAGDNLNFKAGSALAGTTDAAGGNMILYSGASTGTASSNILFATPTPQTSSSSTANSVTTKMTLSGNGFLGIGSTNPSAVIHIAGSKTGTPSANGSQLLLAAATFTDSATAASGTASTYVGASFSAPTLAASNTGVTTTNVQNVRISGPVNSGTNETITNDYGLYIASNNVVSSGGTVTNATSLAVFTPTGASNNYTAVFSGGNVGVGSTAPASTLQVSGSFQLKVTSASSSLSLDSTHYLVTMNANAAARVATLPAASSSLIGRIYILKKNDSSANTVTLAASGSDTIDGAATVVLTTQWQTVRVICLTSTTWGVI